MSLLPLLAEWAAARGISLAPRGRDGRVSINVDGEYRISIYPAPDNRLLFEARICELPSAELPRDTLIGKALAAATARMKTDRARLTASAGNDALILQQEAASDGELRAFNEALAGFINSLAAWRVHLQA